VETAYSIWRGETDLACAWFGKTLAERDSIIVYLKMDLQLTRLHADSRWNVFFKTIGLPAVVRGAGEGSWRRREPYPIPPFSLSGDDARL
jgi:hypothetical protein